VNYGSHGPSADYTDTGRTLADLTAGDAAIKREARLDALVDNLCCLLDAERDAETIRNVRAEEAEADLAAARAEIEQWESVTISAVASLAAAISLLKAGGKAAKKGAASDKMFDQMIRDYERALDNARAALAPKENADDAR
jgi:hypothetical protein